MEIKDIAEYEDTDSELAKYTISDLHHRINKAIKYINEMTLTSNGYADYGDDLRPEHIIDILKGSE